MPRSKLPYNHHKEEGRRGRSFFFLNSDIERSLTGISQAHRVSLTLVLMAIYQLSLARWSGQTEILSAAYTADRIRPEFQNTIGFLVTNTPVCARFDRSHGFLPFLRDFAREFYGSYAHRELSCELYDAIFSPAEPFCATVFNFVPLQKNFFDSEQHAVPAFDGTLIGPDASRPSIYREIYLGLTQYPNGILGKVFYNADRFTPESIENFIQHFRNVVRRVAADPDVKLRELLDVL
jgi:non-ribosomal peptide synthetase component F